MKESRGLRAAHPNGTVDIGFDSGVITPLKSDASSKPRIHILVASQLAAFKLPYRRDGSPLFESVEDAKKRWLTARQV